MAIQDINNQYLLEDGFDRDYIRDLIENRRIPGGGSSLPGGGIGGTGTTYVGPDTTYSSGFNYARSIAGGIPASQMIQSGVSYSPDMPGGYDQEFLNRPPLPPQPQPFPIAGPVTPPLPMSQDAVSAEPLTPGFQLPNFFANIPKFDPSKLQNFSGIKLFDFDLSKFLQSTPAEENNLGIPNFSIDTAAPRTDVGAILDSERRLNEKYGSNLKNFIPPMPQPTDPTINPIDNISVTPPADAVSSVPTADTAAPRFLLSPPMDQPMMGEDGLMPLERPNLPQPNFVPPTMTPPAPIPSEIPSRGGLLQMPSVSPITPNINFEAPVIQKPVMPKQEGLFPTVGRGISAVRGAQEGFDEFKEGLKKQAIKGLFGIG